MDNLSVCIITKNECDNLDICLSKLQNLDVEIVVVDTGSIDNSKEVARKYTDCVYDFEWCNDFSAARNFAVSKATGDYIFMLDTDEFVDNIDMNELYRLIKEHPCSVGRMHRKNLYQTDGNEMTSNELVNRIFPKSLFHYEGRIHEQITFISENDNSTISTYIAPIFTTHVGYQGSESYKAQKSNRNLSLLLIELENRPDDPYILYQIAKAYFYNKGYNEAIPYLEQAMELPLDIKLSYVHNIIITYAYCLIYTKRYSDALMLEALYTDLNEDADYLFVMGLIYMYNAHFENAITCFEKATTIPDCTVEGVNSYSAFYNIGVIFECLGDKEKAMVHYTKCGNYKPATEGILRIKESTN